MNALAINIKKYRKMLKLSQLELAKALDISQTSVAHYENAKRKPTIEVLLQLSKLYNISLESLLGAESRYDAENIAPHFDINPFKQKLLSSLIEKDYHTFYTTMLTLVKEISLEEIIKDVITVLQFEMGLQWEMGKISVADEHYATQIIRRSMAALYPLEPLSLVRKKAVALSVGTEEHTLGLELISSFLHMRGIETWFLGSHVPMASLNKMILDYKPDFVFLSVTLDEHVNTLMMMLESMSTIDGLNICIGGPGIRHVDPTSIINTQVHLIKDWNALMKIIEEVKTD